MTALRMAPIEADVSTLSVPKEQCGYMLEDGTVCGDPSLYKFRMTDWPSWRCGNTCAVHARTVRHWPGLEYIRTRRNTPTGTTT